MSKEEEYQDPKRQDILNRITAPDSVEEPDLNSHISQAENTPHGFHDHHSQGELESYFNFLSSNYEQQNQMIFDDEPSEDNSLLFHDGQDQGQSVQEQRSTKMDESQRVEEKEEKEEKGSKAEEDPRAKFLLRKRTIKKQNKNTPRFIVRMAIKYLPMMTNLQSRAIGERVERKCQRLEQWHLENRRNVYLMNHLCQFFSDNCEFGDRGAKMNRASFQRILMSKAIQMMQEPRSQINNNRLDYLRCAKIYALRCRSSQLIGRNQCQ